MEPTIVFAGVTRRDLKAFDRVQPDAVMFSWNAIRTDKKLQELVKTRLGWEKPPRMYLDSGVFTFLRRAGLTQSKTAGGAATFDEFRAFAKSYIDYLRDNAQYWDHVIELDVDALYGVAVAEQFRQGLHRLVGDRLLPVWHPIRGEAGWAEMLDQFKYVAVSLSGEPKAIHKRAKNMIRQLVRLAHERGRFVHYLGMSTIETAFQTEVDTLDSSSWSASVRWGEFKINEGKVVLPKYASGTRRPIPHVQLAQLQDFVAQWGYTLEQTRMDYYIAAEIAVRLLLQRQEELRARRNPTPVG